MKSQKLLTSHSRNPGTHTTLIDQKTKVGIYSSQSKTT